MEVYGKYQLIAPIASGGMAEVWLAKSSSIGGFEKFLAIKRLHSSLSENPNFVSLFIEEAKLSVTLSHPNIVQIFDFGRVDDSYYIAMECVDGVDLSTLSAEMRARGEPLAVEASTWIMKQVFDGLAHAHAGRGLAKPGGIIHRDVSPHNVLVAFDGQVKISDFGIAKAAQDFGSEDTGELVGKVAYMSPEQARGEILTTATDVWAAGVTLHELLTNRRLFAQRNEEDTLEAVASGTIAPPSSINPAVPAEVDRLTLRLLARDPKARPTSKEAAESLAEVLRLHHPRMSQFRLEEIVTSLFEGQFSPFEELRREVRRSDSADLTPTGPRRRLEPEERTEPPGEFDDAIAVEALKDQFAAEPNLWLLVDIGRAHERAGRHRLARAAYWLAAGKFAQAGLLVQAVAIARDLIDQEPLTPQLIARIAELPGLAGVSDEALTQALVAPEDEAEFGPLLETARGRAPVRGESWPRAEILSALSKEQFVRLVQTLTRREFAAQEVILREGDPGNALYWIGRGRVVVSANNFEGRRVYLTSLADGDCFGEQGFFTGEARTATVEATTEVIVLEANKAEIEGLVQEFPTIRDALRQFYKDRLAESLLARSPLFGKLGVRERRSLAQHFQFVSFATGSDVILEGDPSQCFYAIKAGRLQVHKRDSVSPVELAVLGPGEVFGEVAALKGTPRTASVRALSPCELLRVEAVDLKRFLDTHEDVRLRIERVMEQRLRANSQRTLLVTGAPEREAD